MNSQASIRNQSHLATCTLPLLAICSFAALTPAKAIEWDPLDTLAEDFPLLAASIPLVGGNVIITPVLSISGIGRLDLVNNALIVISTNFAIVEGYVKTGFHGGLWDGIGINSSKAANDPTFLTAVGVISNEDALYTDFRGVNLTAGTETLAAYTYYGDANLDGDVNDTDFALMGLGLGWYFGDFNYSGAVDAADYALYNASFNALHPAPEPGALACLAFGTLALVSRSRVRA